MKSASEQHFEDPVILRAIRTQQSGAYDLYAFFIAAADILQIADISRIKRDGDELQGFQRKEIRAHVNSIVEFLDSGAVLLRTAVEKSATVAAG